MDRRIFLKGIGMLFAFTLLPFKTDFKIRSASCQSALNLPVSKSKIMDTLSHIYCAKGDTPERNMLKILEMLGGIKSLIDTEDIVILKPNAQWWSQGMTNTNAMKAFIEAVLALPNFKGEVIIAENHQYDKPNSRGWTTKNRNGDFNLNELVEYFQEKGHANVTKYHWKPVTPQTGTKQTELVPKSKIMKGPWQGDGYVYNKNLYYETPLKRRCILSYPIFTSPFSGTVIDFKNGAWRNNNYTKQPVKFINFSGINHHGGYAGVTASVKNYMGVVDMSCGAPRGGPQGYFNFHHIGVRDYPSLYYKMPWRLQQKIDSGFNLSYKHKFFYYSGEALGTFMKQIRMADLNIITADWVGFGSRTDTHLSGYPRAIAAGTDPVALDYWTGREILLPLTKSSSAAGEPFIKYNDPDNIKGPFRRFLAGCHSKGIGTLSLERMKVVF